MGSIIAAGVRFTNNITFGNFNIINQNVTIAHDCILENFIHVAPGVNISGNIHLKNGCWLGTGSTVNQGSETKKILIGENCVVGSGAVVLSDCGDNQTYAGVPAVRIK
jgi:acetyltransferase-like isoleucine patch superfamily enzyme